MSVHTGACGLLFLASLAAGCSGTGTYGPSGGGGGDGAGADADGGTATSKPGNNGGASGQGGGRGGADAGGGEDDAAAAAGCEPGVPTLTVGQKITLKSTPNGNSPREYCFVVPGGASQVRLSLRGGTCSSGDCIGDDVELYLKRGAQPDPFDPDAATTQWTYTPGSGAFGDFTKPAAAGPWYLSVIDGQNTLGYQGVAMTLTLP